MKLLNMSIFNADLVLDKHSGLVNIRLLE